MGKTYIKGKRSNKRYSKRLISILIIIIGGIIFGYTFFPLISWQIYFAPAFASQKIETPIPNTTVINPTNIGDLISNATSNIGTDFKDAYNWYPGYDKNKDIVAEYKISIPKINVFNANVSNKDTDLSKHLVQYNSDSVPPNEGNSVIFGHSTLPQLFKPNDYNTIFANAYKLGVGDQIIVHSNSLDYAYKIESIIVVDPSDTSVLAQNFSDSYITIITCTPPGTVWKRLVIKARRI